MPAQHVDVLIVGAGISGIGAAYHLQTECPARSFVILEARGAIGGTWDLFRYPGVRSDSDMYTLGYAFRPWTEPKAIADGPAIREYLRATSHDYGIDRRIRFHHRVQAAAWSSDEARWTVEVKRTDVGDTTRISCDFLFLCSGYYRYEAGYTPAFAGTAAFRGRIVHPQQWPDDLDYAKRRVVVIGSGATAVTLVPALAETAAHVTMLQRSPTYVVSMPARDRLADWLRGRLPTRTAYLLTRWRNVLLGGLFFWYCRRFPQRAKAMLVKGVARALPGVDVARHFTPRYNPWDQRLCLVPDGDLFAAIQAGRATVVTDEIERFTARGLKLRSGAELLADVIVTATGLELEILGGVALTVDGQRVDPADTLAYKGMMLSGVPNLAISIGYTNASWTLKCDLTCEYVCRLLNHMAARGYSRCVPRADARVPRQPLLDFSSGYVQRAIAKFPKQGPTAPWRLYQNYLLDLFALRYGSLDDGAMEFSAPQRDAAGWQQAAG